MKSEEAGQLVELAVVTKALGLRGEVVARLFNPGSPLWRPGQRFSAIGGERPEVTVETVRVQGQSAVLAFVGVTSRAQAEALVGAKLALPRAVLPAPADGELYLSDVIGFAVRAAAGRERGVVTAIEEGGGRELWPAEASLVRSIDAAARTLTLALEGLE